MLRKFAIITLSAISLVFAGSSCKHEPYVVNKGNFPEDVSAIMVRKCATEGCHDAAGAVNAAGLRLDSWDGLFKGSSHGAVVVPYSTKYSSLLYYINLEAHGNGDIIASPTMPYNAAPLTKEEYNIIKSWIANGAPDANGNIAFASDADTRQKIYITQQLCEDLLTVVDASSGLVMRYTPVGIVNGTTEVAHNVKVSPDGRYAYVCFVQGTIVQKIDTRTDQLIGTANIGSGNWNVINLSPDGSRLLVSDLAGARLTLINTGNMSVINANYLTGLTSAHGIAGNSAFDTLYVTSQNTNIVYRYAPADILEPVKEIYLKGNEEIAFIGPGNPNPHEIIMSPDFQKLYVSCEGTDDVRVFDVNDPENIDSIAVGKRPKELAISKKRNLLFVTCIDDVNTSSPKARGSVYVINMSTNQVIKEIRGDFHQPHGIAVDEQNNRIYIASENRGTECPTPHHSSGCDGRNGWYSIYDLNTLEPVNNIRYEVTPDPYGMDVRFK
jgi:DNA-binding beta-propeller fold protein YncE